MEEGILRHSWYSEKIISTDKIRTEFERHRKHF